VDALTKTWVSLGLVFLAVLQYWTAMEVFGKRPGRRAKLLLLIHRIGGYLWMAYFIFISWVCVGLTERLSSSPAWSLDARGFYHAFLAMTLFMLFLVKLSFVRVYTKYRQQARLIGVILSVGTIVLWGISGWMFLMILGNTQPTP
jgi:hypothetical protein